MPGKHDGPGGATDDTARPAPDIARPAVFANSAACLVDGQASATGGDERHQAFLLQLGDALRGVADTQAPVTTVAELLGGELGADRAGYGVVDASGEVVSVEHDWSAKSMTPLAGEARLLDAFGPAVISELRAGRTLVVEDCQSDPRTSDPAHLPTWLSIDTRALIVAPLIRAGRLAAILYVHSRIARRWTGPDVELAEQVAEYTWDAVERAWSQAVLRESEERFRFLDRLGEATANAFAPREIMAATAALLGRHLRVARCAYADVDADSDHFTIRDDWTNGIQSSAGEYSLDLFGSRAAADMRAGQTLVVRDVDAELSAEDGGGTFSAIGIKAIICCPLVKKERLVAMMAVHHAAPRNWTRGEVTLLETVVERAWAHIERVRAEAALRESEERLRLIVEGARDYAILTTDPEGRIDAWMPGAAAVFGWSPEEAVGNQVAMTFTPEDREQGEHEKELETASRLGAAANVRWHLRKDGVRVFIEGRTTALRRPDGTIRGFLKIGQNVTERRRTEEALRESEARFRHMADSAPALIWMTDAEGAVTFANMHFDHMFGRPASEMLGDGWKSVVLQEDLGPFAAAFDAAFMARQVFRAEVRVRDRDGTVRWLRCEGVPRLDDAGRFLGYTGCNVDITEARLASEELERRVTERTAALMTAEESLRQAQKMEAVGQLTGGIAHDFNNMLQGVTGGLAMALRRMAEGRAEDAVRYLDVARDAAARAAGLTRRLLAFARRQRLEPRPVDADSLVNGLADLIRRTVGPGIAVELRLCGGTGSVLCDANELESALLNLCINARDAMPEGGSLTLGTEVMRLATGDIPDGEAAPGTFVAISVTDTGSGMPPDVLQHAFDPFFTTKPQGQGTGLGLSQVWGFVRQSGGLARIDSLPGRGTTVRLLMPMHEGTVAVADEPETPLLPQEDARGIVLLVDDEDAVRGPVADRLRELGLAVVEARDGLGALLLLDSVRPDLLVTDVGLPGGLNGRQVAEAARERLPELPVLFITGYAGISLPAGIEVISKPFDLDALIHRVRIILSMRRRGGSSDPRS